MQKITHSPTKKRIKYIKSSMLFGMLLRILSNCVFIFSFSFILPFALCLKVHNPVLCLADKICSYMSWVCAVCISLVFKVYFLFISLRCAKDCNVSNTTCLVFCQ